MENNNTPKRIHPLVAGAAISVILVSLTGVAAITGLIPSSHSTTPAEQTQVASSIGNAAAATSPAALVENKGEEKTATNEPARTAPPVQQHAAKAAHTQSHRTYAAESTAVAQASVICYSCGRVESVQAVQQASKPSGLGVVTGAVLGGLLGNQVGGGNGRALATVAGAVGGGYAGNEVEKRARSTTSYRVRVRMEDGSIRSFPYAQQPGWSVGDRVRVVNGQLTSRA